jgi:PPP family 3-phenylpropionic acid transporter
VKDVPFWRLAGYYGAYFAFLGAFAPYFGLYLQQRGLSAWHIAVLLSQMQLMRIVAPIAWGWIADHSGRPVTIVRVSAILSLGGMGAFLLADSMLGWFATIAVMAFFWSAALPLVEVVTMDRLGAATAAYPRIRLWGSIGFIAAVLAIGALIDAVSLQALPWALMGLLLAVVGASVALPGDQHSSGHAVRANIRLVLRQPRVRRLLGACFFMSVAHGALYVFYSIHLAAAGYGGTAIGLLWTLGVLSEIAVFRWGHGWLHWASPRWILAVCLLAAALRFALIGWGVGVLALLILAQLLHGLTFGAFHAVSVAAIHRWFPAGSQSRGQALYSSVSFGAGGFAGGILAGALWEPWGGTLTYTVSALFALAGIGVVGGAALWRGIRRRGLFGLGRRRAPMR